MTFATILAAIPDDGTAPVPLAGAVACFGFAGWLYALSRRAPDEVTRCLRRLRVVELQDAPPALDAALRARGLRPVAPWQVAAWLDGAAIPAVPAAMAALHLGGREGARVLLRLARGR